MQSLIGGPPTKQGEITDCEKVALSLCDRKRDPPGTLICRIALNECRTPLVHSRCLSRSDSTTTNQRQHPTPPRTEKTRRRQSKKHSACRGIARSPSRPLAMQSRSREDCSCGRDEDCFSMKTGLFEAPLVRVELFLQPVSIPNQRRGLVHRGSM